MNFSLKNEKQFKKCLSLKTVLRDQFRTIYKPVQKVKKPVIFENFYKISNILNYTLHQGSANCGPRATLKILLQII